MRRNFSEVILNDAVAQWWRPWRKLLGEIAAVQSSLAEEISEPLTGNVVIAGSAEKKFIKF